MGVGGHYFLIPPKAITMKQLTIELNKAQLQKLGYEAKKRNRNLENTLLDIIDEIKEQRKSILMDSEDYYKLNYPNFLPFFYWADGIRWVNLVYLDPLSAENVIFLSENYEMDVICDKMIKMENYGAKIRKYRSLFLTLRNWLKNEKTKHIHQ